MNLRWDQFGARAGIGMVVAGFVFIFLGWNGAASVDRVPSQFPYLISGGMAGLCLVVVGVGLMIVQNQREDRARLQGSLDELKASLEKLAGSNGSADMDPALAAAAGLVLAGPNAYHRPTCSLIEGRGTLPPLSRDAARAQGLDPCRTCGPDDTDADATVQMRATRSPRRKAPKPKAGGTKRKATGTARKAGGRRKPAAGRR